MTAAELFTSDVTASDAAMIDRVLETEGRQSAKVQISRGTICGPIDIPTVKSSGNSAHSNASSSTFGVYANALGEW
jgi:hypothetical protein